jgi:uncharacterized protein YndB with AHSA1/START domain
MTTTTQEPVSLKLSRFIKAPRERVFAAWTNVNELAQWLGCGPRKVILAKNELRVGGTYEIKTITEEGGEMNFAGEYREIKAPSRLVFTWKLGNCFPEFKDLPTQVTIDLAEEKGGTLLTLTHEGLLTGEVRDKHNYGWTESLNALEKLV